MMKNKKQLLFFLAILTLFLAFVFQTLSYAETDVTGKVSLTKSALSYDRLNKTSYLDVSLKNISSDVLLIPIKVVIESISDSGVKVTNADGTTATGKPYFSYATQSGQLLSNQSSSAKKWVFSNPKSARFTYTYSVRGTLPEAVGVIGPGGGTVQVTNTNSPLFGAKVVIPAGEVNQGTVVTLDLTDISSVLPQGYVAAGRAVELGPAGSIFTQDVLVTVPYDDKDNDGIVDYTNTPEDQVGVTFYDSATGTVSTPPVVSRDLVGNTVTIAVRHFSAAQASVNDCSRSKKNVTVYTIDGLSFLNTLNPFNVDKLRTGYLYPAILNLNLGLMRGDVKSYGGPTTDEGALAWDGNAENTPKLVPHLAEALSNSYCQAKREGRGFALVTHSWGTVLGTLALQYAPLCQGENGTTLEVNPDLFITLSTPFGAASVLPDPDYLSVDAVAMIGIYTSGKVLSTYQYQVIPPNRSPYDFPFRWVNYWARGDLISGPIGDGFPAIDIDLSTSSARNTKTTPDWHALIGLIEPPMNQTVSGNLKNSISTEISALFRPILESSNPINMAISVPVTNRSVSFTFSEPMNTIVDATNAVSWQGLGLIPSYQWSADGTVITYTFPVDLPYGTTITWTLNSFPALFTSAAGNLLPLTKGSFSTTSRTTYAITGTITYGGTPLAGVTITLSGDAAGSYSFTDIPNGSYTITPFLTGYTFNPSTASAPVSNANLVKDFVATTISDGSLFQDDFTSGNDNLWTRGAGAQYWNVENGEYSAYIINQCQVPGYTSTGPRNWGDYVLEFDTIILPPGVTTGIEFGARGKTYSLTFRTGWYWDGGYNYAILGLPSGSYQYHNYTLPQNTWYSVRIESLNNNIKVYAKPRNSATYTMIIDYTDTIGPSMTGYVTLFAWSGDACVYNVHYDNIKVTALP
jgi:hypothetical protein